MRGKGEAVKIKGPGGSRGARVPCFVLYCQACDLNLERPLWRGRLQTSRSFIRGQRHQDKSTRALHTALFALGVRIWRILH